MANYTHAKIAFDEAVGQTLDVNNISHGRSRGGPGGQGFGHPGIRYRTTTD